MTAINGLFLDQRDRLGGGQADNHATDKSWSGSRGDAVDRVIAKARLRHGIGDDDIERFDMGARGDFRHNTAKRGVFTRLR